MLTSTLPLGQRIKAAREAKKLSHDRLAEKVGTSRQHLIRIEKGVHTPRADMLARISEALETPFSVEKALADDEEEARAMVAAIALNISRLVEHSIRSRVSV